MAPAFSQIVSRKYLFPNSSTTPRNIREDVRSSAQAGSYICCVDKPTLLSSSPHLSLPHFHDVQLFGRHGQAHIPSLKCLETISSPGNASQVVRHFAARGYPWIQEVTLDLLLRGLLKLANLVSLGLDMGSLPEELIFTESQCLVASFLPHLHAVSIHHYGSTVQLLKTRLVENTRIKSDFGAVAFLEVLPALRCCSTSLISLQIWLSIPDIPSSMTVMDHLARELPLLWSLGITFTFPTPHWAERLLVSLLQTRTDLIYAQSLSQSC